MSTTHRHAWSLGLGSFVLLRIDLENAAFMPVIRDFFYGVYISDSFIKIMLGGKDYIMLYSSMTYDLLSKSLVERFSMPVSDPEHVLRMLKSPTLHKVKAAINVISPDKKPWLANLSDAVSPEKVWPAGLPDTLCTPIVDSDDFHKVCYWFNTHTNSDFITIPVAKNDTYAGLYLQINKGFTHAISRRPGDAFLYLADTLLKIIGRAEVPEYAPLWPNTLPETFCVKITYDNFFVRFWKWYTKLWFSIEGEPLNLVMPSLSYSEQYVQVSMTSVNITYDKPDCVLFTSEDVLKAIVNEVCLRKYNAVRKHRQHAPRDSNIDISMHIMD